eukprot:441794-Pelagomonas_calceolata.AAC.1
MQNAISTWYNTRGTYIMLTLPAGVHHDVNLAISYLSCSPSFPEWPLHNFAGVISNYNLMSLNSMQALQASCLSPEEQCQSAHNSKLCTWKSGLDDNGGEPKVAQSALLPCKQQCHSKKGGVWACAMRAWCYAGKEKSTPAKKAACIKERSPD